jgi:hypothetical protein
LAPTQRALWREHWCRKVHTCNAGHPFGISQPFSDLQQGEHREFTTDIQVLVSQGHQVIRFNIIPRASVARPPGLAVEMHTAGCHEESEDP